MKKVKFSESFVSQGYVVINFSNHSTWKFIHKIMFYI